MRYALSVLIIMGFHCAEAQPKLTVRFQVLQAGGVSCASGGTPGGRAVPWISFPLRIEVTNISENKTVTGLVTVVNERIYRSRDKKMVMLRETPIPDEFGFQDIIDQELLPGSTRSVEITKPVYVQPSDFQRYEQNKAALLLSFRVSNLHHNGDVDTEWTDPMLVSVSEQCASGGRVRLFPPAGALSR
jgi:hypothetical protein